MSKNKTIVFWGTYDTGKPRVRLLIQAAQYLNYHTKLIHSHIWDGIEDKSQFKGVKNKIIKIYQIVIAYPFLTYKYLKSPPHQHVIVPYMGALDVILLWPWAKLRGAQIHWDVFLSLYDTMVNDRKIFKSKHPIALLLFGIEWLASRLADNCFLDTSAHAQYFKSIYKITNNKVSWVSVGVEIAQFPRQVTSNKYNTGKTTVLFYGQFIPLHGIDIILDAAHLDNTKNIDWIIVGKGQLSEHINRRIVQEGLINIQRIEWVNYEQLIELINKSHICLGIFGNSKKAMCVIPNKIYQIMAAGKTFITARTPGIASLNLNTNRAVRLISPNNSSELIAAVKDLIHKQKYCPKDIFEDEQKLPIIGVEQVAKELNSLLNNGSK
jgi:glycosyltransferase involved in cell wall biosynthesis